MIALPLTPVDVDRLARICGMFGSSHDGERAAAAAKADAMVRQRGLTWPQLLDQLKGQASAGPDPLPPGGMRSHQAQAHQCLASCVPWNGRELDFLTSMATWRRPPSAGQAEWLRSLVERVRFSQAS